jgi:hypothetical protein
MSVRISCRSDTHVCDFAPALPDRRQWCLPRAPKDDLPARLVLMVPRTMVLMAPAIYSHLMVQGDMLECCPEVVSGLCSLP